MYVYCICLYRKVLKSLDKAKALQTAPIPPGQSQPLAVKKQRRPIWKFKDSKKTLHLFISLNTLHLKAVSLLH